MKTLRQLWGILSPADRMKAIGLMAIMLVSVILEMVGVGIVVPLLGLMSADPSAPSPSYLRGWIEPSEGGAKGQLLFLALAAILFLYSIKVTFLAFAAWQQVRFVSRLQSDVASRMFTIYLTQPWTFHLRRNSAELIRNLSEIPTLAHASIGIVGTFAEVLVMVGMLGMLLWFEPVGAILTGSLMVAATCILQRFTRRRVVRWGELFHHHGRLGYKHMLEGLGGAKDVIVLGCEKHFIDSFTQQRDAQVAAQGKQMFVNQLPRLWYELLAVIALSALTAAMVWQGKPSSAMIPTLGLFAAAAFRMLPSANRLSSTLQNIGFFKAVIDTVSKELRIAAADLPGTPPVPMSFERDLSLEQVSYRYPGATADSLSGVSMTIPRGRSIGIVGGSGAGKSTLVDVILGLLAPSAGRVAVDGKDIASDVRAWQAAVGYVPQSIHLCDDSLRRNVALGVGDDQFDETAFRRAIRAAQLEEFVASLPDGADTHVGERGVRLSGGQRQRIGIARALYHDPSVLVLDEATSALDTDTERDVMEAVDALHGTKTVIIVAHRLGTVANCHSIYRLEQGRVSKQGTFDEVFSS